MFLKVTKHSLINANVNRFFFKKWVAILTVIYWWKHGDSREQRCSTGQRRSRSAALKMHRRCLFFHVASCSCGWRNHSLCMLNNGCFKPCHCWMSAENGKCERTDVEEPTPKSDIYHRGAPPAPQPTAPLPPTPIHSDILMLTPDIWQQLLEKLDRDGCLTEIAGCFFPFVRAQHWPWFVSLVPQSNQTVFQLRPGEGVVRLQFQTFLPSEEQQLSVGGTLDQVEDEALRWAVGVFHLQQRVGQRWRTSDGNQQRAVDVQDGWVAVGWEGRKPRRQNIESKND